MSPAAPKEAQEAKLALRRLDREARDARKRWYRSRDVFHKRFGDGDRLSIGVITAEMWAAESALAQGAAQWRSVLNTRQALPVAERWNLAALEKWAQTQGDTP